MFSKRIRTVLWKFPFVYSILFYLLPTALKRVVSYINLYHLVKKGVWLSGVVMPLSINLTSENHNQVRIDRLNIYPFFKATC